MGEKRENAFARERKEAIYWILEKAAITYVSGENFGWISTRYLDRHRLSYIPRVQGERKGRESGCRSFFRIDRSIAPRESSRSDRSDRRYISLVIVEKKGSPSRSISLDPISLMSHNPAIGKLPAMSSCRGVTENTRLPFCKSISRHTDD